MGDCIHETVIDSLGFSLSGQITVSYTITCLARRKHIKSFLLTKLFGSKRAEAVGSWRKLHVEDHINCLF
jgi:hypothetical protein